MDLVGGSKVLSEFDIIRSFFTRSAPATVLGIGDDAALIRPAPGMELAISSDMLVSGRHFFEDVDPYKLGHKSLAVNLSDMAAMGARPRWATLSLALPESVVQKDESWLRAFADGFFALAHVHRVDLIGGDTTNGPLNICVTIIGEAPEGKALRRSGARAGDDIWVSGYLGDAALALAYQKKKIMPKPGEVEAAELEAAELEFLMAALEMPIPRVELGQRLIGLAHSAIDISDGLLADLGHILECSRVAAVVRIDRILRSAAMEKHFPHPLAIECLLAGGDDYELCFTVPKSERIKVELLSREEGIPLTRIGSIEEGAGLVVLDSAGRTVTTRVKGYDHFQV
ncbi:thiamine-phosphate kinase [Nitrosospira multiformis ATCC 25196]|uniref:Thiamine-monophosphate kinase n=1 Tax=Nitrosospira multiformis (strain ATCC 25196 / NCIMB 11849 / C 71) TaxID=323848 RepID=Q2YD49_NITMU|nr:thiamine-phosphate kinase [Nitrosospira multiformis]ABB73322.1 thiamine-phosphate kinase [Nitrosospira multiformis ATCC 25196]SEG01467.1 thiamine-phosphate kinase [Nitrosospira multiformis ATCC 25196]